jgi:UDP-N-acetylmuramoylalanine--D-glutamate ligase
MMNKYLKIAIFGYGVEGRSTHAYLKKHGFLDITILDENKDLKVSESLITGKKVWDHIHEFDLVFRSPGIHPNAFHSVNTTSHINLFLEKCPVPVIGITGTKGKGTTASVLQKMIEKSGKKCFLGGNIGIPPLDFLDEIQESDYVILEISSFQAMTMKASPHIAVVLMVTQEHLNFHKDVTEYVDAKAQMVHFQEDDDYCIYNVDFQNSKNIGRQSGAQKMPFSLLDQCVSDMYFDKEKNLLHIGKEKTIKAQDIALPGMHNINNVIAAAQVARIVGVSDECIQDVLLSFAGLPMHIETIACKNGIAYVNDSFSTIPESGLVALQSFKNQNIVIMLGGACKQSDYGELIHYIKGEKNIAPVFYGEQGLLMYDMMDKKKSVYKQGFEEAFIESKNLLDADKGGVLLLSPACASFDQFFNYKDRGNTFNTLVQKYI